MKERLRENDEVRHDFFHVGPDVLYDMIACGECGFVAKAPLADDGTSLVYIEPSDADTLILMMQHAKDHALQQFGKVGPWFDIMIERLRAAIPEADR